MVFGIGLKGRNACDGLAPWPILGDSDAMGASWGFFAGRAFGVRAFCARLSCGRFFEVLAFWKAGLLKRWSFGRPVFGQAGLVASRSFGRLVFLLRL